MYWVSSQCSTMQHNVTQCSTMYCATSQCSGVMRQQKVIESWIKVSLCHLCSSLLVVQGDRATMCHLVEVPSIYWRIYKDEPTALDLVTLCHLPAPTYSVSLLCQLSLHISITWHLIARVCRIKKTTTVPGYSSLALYKCIYKCMIGDKWIHIIAHIGWLDTQCKGKGLCDALSWITQCARQALINSLLPGLSSLALQCTGFLSFPVQLIAHREGGLCTQYYSGQSIQWLEHQRHVTGGVTLSL